MLHATRCLLRYQNVNNLHVQALCASYHSTHQSKSGGRSHSLPRCSTNRQLSTTSGHLYPPTSTSPRPVSLFLSQDQQRDLKPLLKLTDTSTTHYDLTSYIRYHAQRLASETDADKRARISTTSVFLGTRYEYLIQHHLQDEMGFDLTRVGGKGDGGIDLIGTWTLPVPLSTSQPSSVSDRPSTAKQQSPHAPTFRVLCQAKRLTNSRKPMPALMRELEGTLISASSSRPLKEAFIAHQMRRSAISSNSTQVTPSDNSTDAHDTSNDEDEQEIWRPDLSHLPTLGILLTTRPLTDGIKRAMATSHRPLMYVYLEESSCPTPEQVLRSSLLNESDKDGVVEQSEDNSLVVPTTKIRQIAWNATATKEGLQGFDVVRRYSDRGSEDGVEQSGGGESDVTGEAVMVYQGQPVTFLRYA